MMLGKGWRGPAALGAAVAVAAIAWSFRFAEGNPPENAQVSRAVPGDAARHVRYAEARVRLAELRLAKAEALNTRTPGLLTETDMRRFRNRLEVLREQVAATKEHPHGNALASHRAAARAMARIAEEDLQTAAAAHRRQPQAVTEEDLRQFEVKAEIARLRAELWEDESFRSSPIAVMQMEIDQMSDLLNEVADAVDAAPTINRR